MKTWEELTEKEKIREDLKVKIFNRTGICPLDHQVDWYLRSVIKGLKGDTYRGHDIKNNEVWR